MSYYPELGNETPVEIGEHIRAIGWLNLTHPYSKGIVPGGCREKLEKICHKWLISTKALGWSISAGLHECEYCNRYKSNGNIGIPNGSLLYVFPEMIVHYITEHNYQPPSEFIDAVEECPLIDTRKYLEAVRRFRDNSMK